MTCITCISSSCGQHSAGMDDQSELGLLFRLALVQMLLTSSKRLPTSCRPTGAPSYTSLWRTYSSSFSRSQSPVSATLALE